MSFGMESILRLVHKVLKGAGACALATFYPVVTGTVTLFFWHVGNPLSNPLSLSKLKGYVGLACPLSRGFHQNDARRDRALQIIKLCVALQLLFCIRPVTY